MKKNAEKIPSTLLSSRFLLLLTLTLVMMLVMMLSTAFTAFAGSFPDVPEDHENYHAIEYLEEHGIIHGYPDGTYKPDRLVNRAEATKIIVGGFDVVQAPDSLVIFPDAPNSEWFFPYVMGGHDAGIIHGYDDGHFRPGDTINLAETLKIVVLAGSIDLSTGVWKEVFKDVPQDEWFAPHAMYAWEHNVVFPDDYGYLHPDQLMTRAAFAEVIYRQMIVMENDGEPFPLHLHWLLYVSDVLPFQIKYDSGDWEILENENDVSFFKPNEEFMQFSPFRLYENSASVVLTLDENEAELDSDQYFANLKLAFEGAKFTEFTFEGFDAFEVVRSSEKTVDWYIYLTNGDVLVIYTEYGEGPLVYQLPKWIKAMLSTLAYHEPEVEESDDYEELLSEIFENVLVEGKGEDMINKLPDALIIETDTIGVGTGPVDYYYSESVDHTFKYEREGDVILDTREGETTAF